MSTTAVSTLPNSPPPAVDQVFAFADLEIGAAAAEQWPHAYIDLGDHIPGVTGYVRRITVDGRAMYAKYSLLGTSLVSLLRGACGPWPQVREAQWAYVLRPDALITREAAHLRLLLDAGRPRVCPVAGVRRGVLFTEHVGGASLAQLLLERPAQSADLLVGAFGQLRDLHHPPAVRRLGPAGFLGERSIVGTFQRKFNGLSGPVYRSSFAMLRPSGLCWARDRPGKTALSSAGSGSLDLRVRVSRPSLWRLVCPFANGVLQAGGEANLVVAARSVAGAFRRSRTLLRGGDGSLACSR